MLSDLLAEHFRLTPRQTTTLVRLGIATIRDLLFYFPSRYEEFVGEKTIAELKAGERATVACEVEEIRVQKTWKKKISVAEAVVKDESGFLRATWFNQPYIVKMLKQGDRARLSGKVGGGKNGLYLANPAYEITSGYKVSAGPSFISQHMSANQHGVLVGSLLPVYSESYGISSRWLGAHIKKVLEAAPAVEETIPDPILSRYHLPKIRQALRAVHFPKTKAEAGAARKRFAFEEVFVIQLARRRDRKMRETVPAFFLEPDPELVKEFVDSLPYELTDAQKRALNDILDDFKKRHPMTRLLQGDVGSGKTVVAAASSLAAVKAGLQVAFMAPTEILARQHFEELRRRLGPFRVPIGFLTSSGAEKFPSKINPQHSARVSKNQLLRWIASGEIKILVGTHSLIGERVKFKKLGLTVVDEQHRFGVNQRGALIRRQSRTEKAQTNADTSKLNGLLYEDITYKIRGCAFRVKDEVGSGHKESVYHNALAEALKSAGLCFEQEKHIPVLYQGKKVGTYKPDFIVEDKIIVELKALPFIGFTETKQVWNYIKGASYKLALLINFGPQGVAIKRIVHDTARGQRKSAPKELSPRESAIMTPHYLSMTATPIPRTLALTFYGDLDVSVIDEMPPGRQPVQTKIVLPHGREEVYDFVRSELGNGSQAFVVCPRIEERKSVTYNPRPMTYQQRLDWSDVKSVKKEYKKLSEEIFPEFKIGMVHGRLTSKEKETMMREFRDGKLQVLVSTSVIEVGVDIPNASMMLIEGGERFGLATLHQFRGRVGRRGQKAYCFVFTTNGEAATLRRLKALEGSKSGFELAEYDLQFRGPGELAGSRQWGVSDVGMEALKNMKMVEAARKEAEELVLDDFDLKKFPLLKERVGKIGMLHFE